MNIPTFNLTTEAERKLFAIYVDVSLGEGAALWEVQGYGVEDASLEFSPEQESKTDVLGIQHNTVKKMERSMSLDPNTLRQVTAAGRLNEILHEYMRRNRLAEMSQFPVLVVYGYVGQEGAYQADLYTKSTIHPVKLGGSARVEFPVEIQFGGEVVYGTVDKLGPGLKFTPEK